MVGIFCICGIDLVKDETMWGEIAPSYWWKMIMMGKINNDDEKHKEWRSNKWCDSVQILKANTFYHRKKIESSMITSVEDPPENSVFSFTFCQGIKFFTLEIYYTVCRYLQLSYHSSRLSSSRNTCRQDHSKSFWSWPKRMWRNYHCSLGSAGAHRSSPLLGALVSTGTVLSISCYSEQYYV